MLSITPRTVNQKTIVQARLNSTGEESDQLTTYLQALLPCLNINKQRSFNVCVCIGEAINNIIEHGTEESELNRIRCIFTISRHCIDVALLDTGKAYTPPRTDITDIENENGRGWVILRQWTDSINYQRKARINRLSLSFHLG